MISDGILLVLQGILSILLLPIEGLNIAIDFIGSIPVVVSFLQVIAYLLPWSNILPLLVLVVAIVIFKIAISLVKVIWQLIPFM